MQGRVIVKVLDRPDPPQNVTATATGPGSAFVSFQAAAPNGGTISGYTIIDSVSGKPERTTNPGMEVTGLQNGVEHSFTVIAHNEAGDSDPSAPSAPAYVDAVPDQMAAPTVQGTDGGLIVSWTDATTRGSKVHTYTIFVAPQAGGQPIPHSVAAGTENTTTIHGLQNGASYLVSIQAQNGAKSPSPVSNPTQGSPHGPPSIRGNITASTTAMAPDASTATVRVSWTPGQSNGSGWGRAEVTVNNSEPVTANATDPYVDVSGVPADTDVPVKVVLYNADGDKSATATTTVSVATVPVEIAAPTLSGIGEEGKVRVDGLVRVPGRGFDASRLTLRYASSRDACATGTPVENGDTLTVTGWQSQTFYFCQTGVGVSSPNAASPPVAAVGQATGAPSQVGVSITNVNATSLTVRWDPVAANPAVTQIRVTLSNGETKPLSPGATEATFSDLAQGTRYQATVVAVNDVGETVMSQRPTETTKLDVSAQWVETCSGKERGFSAGSCHTFTLSAPGWSGSSSNHTCTVRNEKTGDTQTVHIDGAGPFQTRAITLAGSEDEFRQRGPYLLECHPE